jgi:hypothetical protein
MDSNSCFVRKAFNSTPIFYSKLAFFQLFSAQFTSLYEKNYVLCQTRAIECVCPLERWDQLAKSHATRYEIQLTKTDYIIKLTHINYTIQTNEINLFYINILIFDIKN